MNMSMEFWWCKSTGHRPRAAHTSGWSIWSLWWMKLVEKPEGLWEKKRIVSLVDCAPLTPSRRQKPEQSIAWVAVGFRDLFLWFPGIACGRCSAWRGGGGSQWCIRLSSSPSGGPWDQWGAAAGPGGNAAREEGLSLDGAPIRARDRFDRHAEVLASPQNRCFWGGFYSWVC